MLFAGCGRAIERLEAEGTEQDDHVQKPTGVRCSDDVISTLEAWIADLDQSDPEYQRQLLEGLWVYQQHHRLNPQLLESLLDSPDFRVRAAAVRVLAAWREGLTDPLALLEKSIQVRSII